MNNKLSVALNIILSVGFIVLLMESVVGDHYYREFTGFVLRESARQIDSGNAARVSEVLKEIKGRPSRSDLGSMLEKLNTHEQDKASQR